MVFMPEGKTMQAPDGTSRLRAVYDGIETGVLFIRGNLNL
jgi:hypothetical protein